MTDEITINIESSKEDVADYFFKKFKLKEDIKNNLIKEDISGDVLYDLDDTDLKNLGFKVGPLKKMKTFLKENEDKFKERQITEKITSNSSYEEVESFFKNCLNFSGNLNNLNGKGLIELNDEEIKNLGLNIGQYKKFIKYLNYFKTLKAETPEETEIIISQQSTEEEVAKYFKEKLNFSSQTIENLSLDGETLFCLEESEIDKIEEMNEDEKLKLKNLLIELKGNSQQTEKPEIKITKESQKEEVNQFLKEQLKLSEKAIESLELDGEALFDLEESDIDGAEELCQEEKERLKNFLNSEKEKEKEKDKTPNNANTEENIINKNIPKEEETKVNNISREDKEKAIFKSKGEETGNDKNILKVGEQNVPKNLNNLEENKNKDKNEKIFEQIDKKDLDKKEIEKKENKNIKDPLSDGKFQLLDDKIKGKDKLPKDGKKKKYNKEYEGAKSKNLIFNSLQNYKIQPLIQDSNNNIFFNVFLLERDIKKYNLSTYYDESGMFQTSYIIYKHYFIGEQIYINIYNENVICLLVQIALNKNIKKLSIMLSKDNKESYTEIEIKSERNNFFYIGNINNSINISKNRIFSNYLIFFNNIEEKTFLKSFIKTFLNKISETNVELSVVNILNFFKLCSEFKLDPKNIDNIEPRIEEKKFRKPLNKELFLSGDDIELITLKKEKEKSKLLELLVIIYVNYDIQFLMKLILSKHSKEYGRALLNLLNIEKIKYDDFIFNNEEDQNLLQTNLLYIIESKEEINNVIKISRGLTKSIKFIKRNCKEIHDLLEKKAGYFHWKETNYLSLPNPKIDDDTEEIYKLLSDIINLSKERKYKIINFDEIFESLVNLYKNGHLNELCKLDNLAALCKSQKVKIKLLEDYYNAIHSKGMILIENGRFSVEEIINFMIKQDIYYSSPINKNNDKRVLQYSVLFLLQMKTKII